MIWFSTESRRHMTQPENQTIMGPGWHRKHNTTTIKDYTGYIINFSHGISITFVTRIITIKKNTQKSYFHDEIHFMIIFNTSIWICSVIRCVFDVLNCSATEWTFCPFVFSYFLHHHPISHTSGTISTQKKRINKNCSNWLWLHMNHHVWSAN